MSEFLVRCSAIGALMARPENADLDPAFVTPQLEAILAKTKRTDDEKELVEHARRNSLSAGAKTCVRELLREDLYSYIPAELATRPILKGREVEQECIEMLCRLTGRPLVKNTERRSNGLITGECDIFDAPRGHGRDVKAAFSKATMPILAVDAYDKGYEYQMRGYMMLWDAEVWSVDHLLVDTPDDILEHSLEPRDLHIVSYMDEHLRWTTWPVKRDLAIEAAMIDKINAARKYWRQALAEFDRTHLPVTSDGTWPPGVSVDPDTGVISGFPGEGGVFHNLRVPVTPARSQFAPTVKSVLPGQLPELFK